MVGEPNPYVELELYGTKVQMQVRASLIICSLYCQPYIALTSLSLTGLECLYRYGVSIPLI